MYIFAQDPTRNGRWALDEQFRLCVSGCDAYYESVGFLNLAWPATPVATPAATPDVASLEPVYPDECDVEALSKEEISAITQGAGDDTERSYTPTGPVDAALAQEVAGADRAWQSCFVSGTAGQRAALQSSRLTRDGPGIQPGMERNEEELLAQLERFDASRDLGEAMLSGDWQDYSIESDLFADEAGSIAQTLPAFIPAVPILEQAFHLADGRIAIPIAQLVPPGTYPYSLGMSMTFRTGGFRSTS